MSPTGRPEGEQVPERFGAEDSPVRLHRFHEAQANVIDDVMAELREGRKRSHWMWFVFPQLRELGRSETAKFYGIASLDEARAYLADPVLGQRLKACTRAVLAHRGTTAHAIFGSPDDLKFRSSMTLFGLADPGEPLFREALERFFGGRADPLTRDRVERERGPGNG